MKEMNRDHALQLFCRHAFGSDLLPLQYYDISTKIVATTGGLPLAIKVIGSSLFNQDEDIWTLRLEQLKEAPHMDVQKALMISYEALEFEQQQIFLDIACFFNDEKIMDPIYFWGHLKGKPENWIKILERRSMIKVIHHNKLWMHDQLRDLGKAIALSNIQPPNSQTPIKPNRLWSSKIALDVVQNKKEAKSVVALQLGILDTGCSFVGEEFVGLENLKFLQLQGGNFRGDFKNVLQQLRWLSWFNCPLKLEAANLSFKNLVVHKLSGSQITKDWVGWGPIMVAERLKVLNLTGCTRLTKTPDFSTILRLERLILKRCWKLEEIDSSINKLKHLDYLNIYNASRNSFKGYSQEMPRQPQLLPNSIGGLTSLTILKINSLQLTELPSSIGVLVKMKHLYLKCPQLGNLPRSIGKLKLLIELDMSFSGIKELPDSIGNFKQLNILRMSHSAILCLPNSIGRLESLNELDLAGTNISMLPEAIGKLKMLKVIDLSFTLIRMLPLALGDVENLEELYACNCANMDGELPREIGQLSCLRILKLCDTKVTRVPTTIKQLSHLHELVLGEFYEPQKLPELPTSLTSLEVSFPSLGAYRVPNLSNMINLVTLKLSGGISDESFNTLQLHTQTREIEWLARLAKMEKLTVVLFDLILPPTDLNSLSRLRELDITCFDPQSLTHLPSSLESLTLRNVKLAREWQLFSNLNNLSTLKFHRCWYREIQIDSLGQLKNLCLHILKLEECELLKGLYDLPHLKELRKLEIVNCPHLVDIQGLGEVEFLRSFSVEGCRSLQRLPDLFSLKKLEQLSFEYCESLKSIPEVDEETLCYLVVLSCRHFHDFRGPYKKLKRKALYKTHSRNGVDPPNWRSDWWCS